METAVTWGDIAAIAGWGLLGLIGLAGAAVFVFILLAVAGVFNDWSH